MLLQLWVPQFEKQRQVRIKGFVSLFLWLLDGSLYKVSQKTTLNFSCVSFLFCVYDSAIVCVCRGQRTTLRELHVFWGSQACRENNSAVESVDEQQCVLSGPPPSNVSSAAPLPLEPTSPHLTSKFLGSYPKVSFPGADLSKLGGKLALRRSGKSCP